MEPLSQTAVLPIRDPSQVAVARRAATDLAMRVGLDEKQTSRVSIVTVELANNLLQHAGSGEIFLRYIEPLGAFDIAAVDHGPGMASVRRCMQDGFSTRSTPGLGLGAIQRFAHQFAAYSIPGRTTIVAARMTETRHSPEMALVSTAMQGETLSGDSWSLSDDGNALLVVDGLGHGIFAAEAAQAAVALFQKYQSLEPAEILERMHAALRSTRGAAGALARFDPSLRKLRFAGVGNITCVLQERDRSQNCVSHNGTLGHQMRRVQQFEYSYTPGTLLMMQSDGLTTHSKQKHPASLYEEPPIVVAPFVYSEQVRGRDDATIVVTRLA